MHTKPLSDLFKKEKKSNNFIIFFYVSQKGLICVTLQKVHAGAIAFLAGVTTWISQSSFSSTAWHCSPYLENLLTLPRCLPLKLIIRTCWVWSISFHLTRAETQAETMVGVLQGFDIGLFANPARLMLWLTKLAGRPNAIISCFFKYNHSPWGSYATYTRSCPWWFLFNLEVQTLPDDWLRASQKPDIGI